MNNYLAGKTNSPIPFPAHYPDNIVSGKDAYVEDVSGKKYIDLWMGYGALMFGHANKKQIQAISNQLAKAWFFSYPTALEKEVAQRIHRHIPCAELVRFSTSGSDAVSYAVRASRAYTGRHKILTIDGGYHGVHENMISNTGTISNVVHDKTTFNDIAQTVAQIQTKDYACFIMEPVLANNGSVPADAAFLAAVREACTQTGTVLIFDEVVTGFRSSLSGVQGVYGITPDLATFSKAIAGGLPLSAVCGKKEIMTQYIPTGEVFFAGTFNGSPLSLANALCVMDMLESDYSYEEMDAFRVKLGTAIMDKAKAHNLQVAVQGFKSMMSIAFDCEAFPHGVTIANANSEKYHAFADYLAEHEGVLLPPLFTETIFLSPVHIPLADKLVEAFDRGFAWLEQQTTKERS